MNGNSMGNVCCPTENKETIRGLMIDLMAESHDLRGYLDEIHHIMFGPVDERPVNANNPDSLESAISIILNTVKDCNDIASDVLRKL